MFFAKYLKSSRSEQQNMRKSEDSQTSRSNQTYEVWKTKQADKFERYFFVFILVISLDLCLAVQFESFLCTKSTRKLFHLTANILWLKFRRQWRKEWKRLDWSSNRLFQLYFNYIILSHTHTKVKGELKSDIEELRTAVAEQQSGTLMMSPCSI